MEKIRIRFLMQKVCGFDGSSQNVEEGMAQ